MGRWSRPLARAFVAGCIRSPRPTGSRSDVVQERSRRPFATSASQRQSSPAIRQNRSSSTLGRVSRMLGSPSSLQGPKPCRVETADSTWLFQGWSSTSCRIPKRPWRPFASACGVVAQSLRTSGTTRQAWSFYGCSGKRRSPWTRTQSPSTKAGAFRSARLRRWRRYFEQAGSQVETRALEIPTDFTTFDDYWMPFLRGTGPAPGYVASLDPIGRDLLRGRLERRLQTGSDGRIPLRARAWAVRGVSP